MAEAERKTQFQYGFCPLNIRFKYILIDFTDTHSLTHTHIHQSVCQLFKTKSELLARMPEGTFYDSFHKGLIGWYNGYSSTASLKQIYQWITFSCFLWFSSTQAMSMMPKQNLIKGLLQRPRQSKKTALQWSGSMPKLTRDRLFHHLETFWNSCYYLVYMINVQILYCQYPIIYSRT